MSDMCTLIDGVYNEDNASTNLSNAFMKHNLFKFRIYHLPAIDYGDYFKGIFTTVCSVHNILLAIISKRNHKLFIVEHLYRFWDLCVTIAAGDREYLYIYIYSPVEIAINYAWNSVPTDEKQINILMSFYKVTYR